MLITRNGWPAIRSLLGLALALQSAQLHAQAYPTQPIRLVLSDADNRDIDAAFRAIGRRLGEALGQRVTVENRPSFAGGIAAAMATARAMPDGHTLMLGGAAALTVTPAVAPTAPYDPVRELKALAVASRMRLDSLPDVPTFAELGLAGFETGTWYTVVAPSGTPEAVLERLRDEIGRFLARDEPTRPLRLLGLEPAPVPGPDPGAQLRESSTLWSQVVQSASVKARIIDEQRRRAALAPDLTFAKTPRPLGRFAAVASFYPGCGSFLQYDTDRPLLVLMGAADDESPPASCVRGLEWLKERDAPVQWQVVPEATHSWDTDREIVRTTNRSVRVKYVPNVTIRDESARRLFEFLDANLGRAGVPAK